MNEEKPLELRDQMALSILNGLLSNSNISNLLANNSTININYIIAYFDRESPSNKAEQETQKLIRFAYYLADQMRQVRLGSFE